MNFKEALLFSKTRTVCYDSEDKQHIIKIEEMQEEYKPYIVLQTMEKERYWRTIYCLTIHEVLDSILQDPHKTHEFHQIESCEEFLKGWGINTENGWYIQKEEEQVYYCEECDKEQEGENE